MTATFYAWEPIKPLSESDRQWDGRELDSLRRAWEVERASLQESSPEALHEFNERLLRSWSIETGIIERIYDLDQGATQTLVEHGFRAELIDRGSTNLDPDELVVILNDHRHAAQFIVNSLNQPGLLTVGFIKELHSLITLHQPTTKAMDQFGNLIDVELRRGEFKTMPNNPTRVDGTIHEYCPPIHVDSEMEHLVKWYTTYHGENPIVAAAWLHHRFAQIHPFQDGNGRVARCLVTLELLRGRYLPIVVSRRERISYINALEQSDGGDMEALIQLFSNLEKQSLLKAISVTNSAVDVADPSSHLIETVAHGIAEKLQNRKTQREELRKVNRLAEPLLDFAKAELENLMRSTVNILNKQEVLEFTLTPKWPLPDEGFLDLAGKVERTAAKFTVPEIVYQVNTSENNYWHRNSMWGNKSRFDFVMSMHHVGSDLNGVMACVCFAELINPLAGETNDHPKHVPSTSSPLTFTWKDTIEDVKPRFYVWLNECFAIALKAWGDTL